MTKWEYRTLTHYGRSRGFEEMLNDYGAAGWELVHLNAFKKGRNAPNTYNLVFKRPIEKQEASARAHVATYVENEPRLTELEWAKAL